MRVAVIGVGHVGLVTAACLARWGHEVVGMDDDERKVARLRGGGVPFYEAGLEELIAEGVGAGRLSFTGDVAEALDGAAVAFVCVGTPSLPGGAPNLAYVEAVGRKAAEVSTADLVLVEKSTVPANTGLRLRQTIEREQARRGTAHVIDVASNPEFLREGNAVEDTLHPDRIVVGVASTAAATALREVYAPVVEEDGCPYVETDLATAELIKHASNAFLATKISFINAVALICERVGADVDVVADGMGYDHRIGRSFLDAGMGWGGSCLLADETVLARRDGETRHLSIAELWRQVSADGLDGWEVLSWHPERRTPEFLPVAAATVRSYRGDVIEVRTKMGRRVRCTADHPFVVGDGQGTGTTVKLAGDLSTDDWLPLAVGQLTPARRELARTGPLAAVGAGAVSAPEVIQRLDSAELRDVQARSSDMPPRRRYDVLRNGTIRLDEFQQLGLEPRTCSLGTVSNGTYVPGIIEFDEQLWRVVGLFLAEGHISVDGFTDVLRLGADCYTKRLPDLIWDAPAEHKRALLRGLWDGDGSWSLVNGGPSAVLEYGTVSRGLADGMVRLLSDLGIVTSIRIGRTSKSTVDTYWLRISGADQIEDALWLLPEDEAQEVRATIARQVKRIAPTGYRRFDDESTWVRVTATRREDFDGPVYSLEVPDAHTIVTTGGVVTHNCFPKDVDAFIHLARSVGYDFALLEATRKVNLEVREHLLEVLREELWHLEGKTIALLGAAFKPGTDDLRAAPSMWLAERLLEEGATVRIYDPVALPNVKEQLPAAELHDDPLAAAQDAHALVVCTEWEEVAELTAEQLLAALAYPIVIDGRNVFDPQVMARAGIRYHGVGKPKPEVE